MNLSGRYIAMNQFISHKTYKLLIVMVGHVNANWTIHLGLIRTGNLIDKTEFLLNYGIVSNSMSISEK
jgi:hypothetical protein